MRKLTLLFVCLLFLAVAMPVANAQSGKTSSDVSKFYINLGALANQDFDVFWWQTGAMLDLPLGNNLFITPEVMLIGYKFAFDEVYLFPGATLNLKFGDKGNEFFLGAGLLVYFTLANELGGGDELMLKLHGGFIGDNIKLTIYTYDYFEGGLFDYLYIGANVGFAL
jgi:hypothetical protein